MKKLILALAIISIAIAITIDRSNPPASANYQFKHGNIILNKNQLKPPYQITQYRLTNTSKQTINLNRSWKIIGKSDPGASAGWNTRLKANHFAILQFSQGIIAFNCLDKRFKAIVCHQVLRVQFIQHNHFSESGSYWVKENQPTQ